MIAKKEGDKIVTPQTVVVEGSGRRFYGDFPLGRIASLIWHFVVLFASMLVALPQLGAHWDNFVVGGISLLIAIILSFGL